MSPAVDFLNRLLSAVYRPRLAVYYFAVVSLLNPCIAQVSDSTRGTFAISAQAHYGYLMAHSPGILGLVTGHTTGFQVEAVKISSGNKLYERIYRYPEIGVAYCFFNVGNDKVLGNAHALFSFIDFPLSHRENFRCYFRLGFGIGYIENSFSRLENFKNNAIGSHVNGVMAARFIIKQKLSARNNLSLSFGLTHWSNGSAATPNLGINVNTLSLGYQHYFGERQKLNRDSIPAPGKKLRISFFAAAFHKEIYPAGGKKFFVATLYGNASKMISRKSSLGLGMDIFYNKAIEESIQREGKKPTTADAIRPGIHLCYMLTIGKFDVAFENGIYLYGKLEGDTQNYTRLGLRQKFTKHVFACVNLKTHFFKADFFEFGAGYEL